MNIAIVGTHCTGKSTLVNKFLEENLEWIKISSSTRKSLDFGLEINEGGNSLSQLYMVSCDMKNFIESGGLREEDNLIFDRCFLDTFIYSTYMLERGQCEESVVDICFKYWDIMRNYFDLIFWVRPEFELVGDGIRSTNLDFQTNIDKKFEKYFRTSILTPVLLTGSIEDRLRTIKETVNVRNYKIGK